MNITWQLVRNVALYFCEVESGEAVTTLVRGGINEVIYSTISLAVSEDREAAGQSLPLVDH
jgi:hypothetical protein